MRYLLSILLVFYLGVSWGQSLNPKYKTLLDSFPEKIFDFAIKKTNETKSFCEKENIKIKCEENKMLIFNSKFEHCAVSQTDESKRVVINFNYI